MSLMSRIQDRMQELRDARISEAAASTAEAMASSDVKIMPSENAPAPSDLVPTIALSETIASTSDAIQPRCRHTCESGPTADGQDVSCSSEETTAAVAPSEATPSTPTSNPKRRDGVPGLRVSFDTDSEPVVDDPQPSSIKQSPEAVVESASQLSSATIVVPKPAKVHVPSPASHMINPLEQPPDVPCSWLCCWTHTPSGGWRSAWLFWESPLFWSSFPSAARKVAKSEADPLPDSSSAHQLATTAPMSETEIREQDRADVREDAAGRDLEFAPSPPSATDFAPALKPAQPKTAKAAKVTSAPRRSRPNARSPPAKLRTPPKGAVIAPTVTPEEARKEEIQEMRAVIQNSAVERWQVIDSPPRPSNGDLDSHLKALGFSAGGSVAQTVKRVIEHEEANASDKLSAGLTDAIKEARNARVRKRSTAMV